MPNGWNRTTLHLTYTTLQGPPKTKFGDNPYSKEGPGNKIVHHFCSFYFLRWSKRDGFKMSVCMFGRRCRYVGRYVDPKSSAKATGKNSLWISTPRSTFIPRWPFKKDKVNEAPTPYLCPSVTLTYPIWVQVPAPRFALVSPDQRTVSNSHPGYSAAEAK